MFRLAVDGHAFKIVSISFLFLFSEILNMTSYHIRQIVCGSVWEISVVQFKRKDRGSC